MNKNHTLLTILLSMIELIKSDGIPIKFYSTFGNGIYYYQSDFSKQNSFLKLRDYLQSIDAVRNDSLRVTLNAGNISIGHYNLKYQLHVYENITEPPKMGKLCHLKVFEIKELSNIFIENSEKPVNHIYWMCPPYGWCCGAECCQPFYRNPWPLLGPDFYELVAAITVFAGLLVIPELCRRLRKRKMDNTQQSVSLVVSTGIPGSIMENAEKAQFIA
ncbi:hypothetical protein ACH3XW_39895 [Acanthocheilonema viteae]